MQKEEKITLNSPTKNNKTPLIVLIITGVILILSIISAYLAYDYFSDTPEENNETNTTQNLIPITNITNNQTPPTTKQTTNTTKTTTTTGGGGESTGGGSTSSIGWDDTSCTPNRDCDYYYNLNQCGTSLSNSCENILNCNACPTGECVNGRCIELSDCTTDSDCINLTGVCGTGLCNTTIEQCYIEFNSTTDVCREGGECDMTEYCSGAVDCPTDIKESDGTACTGGTCEEGVCKFVCANDYKCDSAGSFCDGNMPYTCTMMADGCYDRTNGTDCQEQSCLNGECYAGCSSLSDGFVDSFENTDCINVVSMKDVVLESGKISANGVTYGELDPEPRMEVLFHLNGDEPYVHNPIYTRGSYDSSGNGRHGVWQISKDYSYEWLFPSEGKFGNSYYIYKNEKRRFFYFNDVGINPINFTFSIWVKSDNDFANHFVASNPFRILSIYDQLLLYTSQDTITLRVLGERISAVDIGWNANEWHHIAAVINPEDTQLWLDGELKANSSTGPIEPYNFLIGWSNNNLNGTGNISFDEIVIWDYALSREEISSLSKGERIKTGSFESAWIDMGESFNSIKASLIGESLENTKISITCDNIEWETIPKDEWADYRNYGLPCNKFRYKINFYGEDAKLEGISFDWKNIEEDDSFIFIFYGDSTEKGSGTSNELVHQTLVKQMERINPDLVFNTGDMVDKPSVLMGSNETMWQSFLRTTEKLRERKSLELEHGLFGSIGNHEGSSPYTGYFEAFNYSPIYSTTQSWDDTNQNPQDPNNPGYYQNRYYSFKYKGVCFISLFYYDGDYNGPFFTDYDLWREFNYTPIDIHDLSKASEQYKWLYNTLQDCSQDQSINWKVVYFHNPPYGLGGHSASDNIYEIRARQLMRQTGSPLFEYFNVSLVDTGHDHLYVRTHPILSVYDEESGYYDGVVDEEGVVYLCSPMGGEDGYSDNLPAVDPVPDWAASWYGRPSFVKINVTNQTLYGEAINYTGDVVDRFEISSPEKVITSSQSEYPSLSIWSWFKGLLTGKTIKAITGNFLKT